MPRGRSPSERPATERAAAERTAAERTPVEEAEFIRQMLRGEIEPIYPPRLDELGLSEEEPLDPSGIIESLCGVDNSQDVEQYDGTLGVTVAFVASHERPVGQIQWNNNLGSIYTRPGDVSGVRWCTGTMISNDLFISAGHCFDQTPSGWTVPRANGTMNPISSAEIATNMHINFNYQRDPSGNLRAETSYPITALVEHRLTGLDYAIVRIGSNPGAIWGRTTVAQNDAAQNDMLCIIQHPAGLPKRIEAGPLSDFVGNAVRYNDIDTLGGSSGSGILGPNGSIVGIHTNGGCQANMTGHNFGVRISAIRAASPTIQGLPGAGLTIKKAVDDPPVLKKPLDDPPRIKKLVDDPVQIKKPLDDPPIFKKIRDDVFIPVDPLVPIPDPAGFTPVPIPFDPRVADPAAITPIPVPGDPRVTDPLPVGGARPFVLATPHHATVGGVQAAAGAAGGEQRRQQLAQCQATLWQVEQAIAQGVQDLSSLQQTKQAILAQVQALAGSGG